MCTHKLTILGLALAADWLLGEPPNRLHPVVWLGSLVGVLQQRAPIDRPRAAFFYGGAMTAVTVAVAVAPAQRTGRMLKQSLTAGRPAGVALHMGSAVFLLKTAFAWRTLLAAGERVYAPLAADELPAARAALRWLVSRETATLDEPLIAAAAIESLAENASDSLVAPLVYYTLYGLSGAWMYRAVNTLDAMVGYRGRYEYLGKVPARLDDLLNLAPARLTALLIVAAAALTGADAPGAWQAWRRDARLTASPNAGHPMSAVAGALGVRLEKVGHYCLNPAGRPPAAVDLRRAARLVNTALALGVALTGLAPGLGHVLKLRMAPQAAFQVAPSSAPLSP